MESRSSSAGSKPTAECEDDDANFANDASSLDHALLESLFYNEMMLMEESPSLLLSALAADGTPTSVDPSTVAEKALLHDFGVSSFPAAAAAAAASSSSRPGTLATIAAPLNSLCSTTAAGGEPQSSHLAPVAPAPVVASTGSLPPILASACGVVPSPLTTTTPNPPFASPGAPAATAAAHQYQSYHSSAAVAQQQSAYIHPQHQPAPAATISTNHTANTHFEGGDKRNKLISQFATLASRLGISLPPELVQSLTAAAATKEAAHEQQHVTRMSSAHSATSAVADPPTNVPATTSSMMPSSITSTLGATSEPPEAVPPPRQVQELQSAAEAAIAAVVRKRSRDEGDSTTTLMTGAAINAANNNNAKQLPYTKRRKKPRLSDCESRLAALQTENAVLKRHLHNITDQSHRLNQEQRLAEEKIRQLFLSNAGDDELDEVVKHYTEKYSDYGKRRHQELAFHLEQLERLASPTNFTKMGLWTLGKSSPIAGMLQKELGITPQQGRKILEQREKIRSVSTNLHESLILLGKLKELCEQKTQIFNDRMSKCREILTPRQVAKLLLWIHDNSTVLGNVCPGWGSEQFRSK